MSKPTVFMLSRQVECDLGAGESVEVMGVFATKEAAQQKKREIKRDEKKSGWDHHVYSIEQWEVQA